MSGLALNAASLRYDNGFTALNNVTAAFDSGSFTALVGPSGCGKSSLLRLLAGLEHPFIGSVTGLAQSDIGFVFQEPTLLAWRNVADNITLPLKIEGHNPSEIGGRLDEALALVGLTDFADALPRQLSGGMKMRVSLARALAKRPPVLLMDEPFAALDELTRFRLDDDLRAIWQQQKCTIIFVTHSVTEAAYLAERALVMQDGEIQTEITIDQNDRDSGFRSAPAFSAACNALSAALGHGMETKGEA
ncbi:MAG: Aliphatic sulfonates import ATP-binding protein SsuB [Alphaproteobacteria bacterium]|nr:MAG: Aliphatic sulfonates import ATP-binding protein SsuB [Alphaproteobacteria bacterium]